MSRFGGYEYDPFLAEVYDYLPPYQTRADVDFYLSLSRAAGGKTLELGCGTGRILVPTAQAGCEIVGLELSPHMLTKCREKLAQQPPEVQERARLVPGNMTEFDLGETFALVTTPFRSFQHLTSVEEQFACLGCVHRHLRPGGRLVVDVFQPDFRYLQPSDGEVPDFADAPLPDGRRLSRSFRVVAVHRATQCNEVELIYTISHPDGRRERVVQPFRFRYFFRYELEHLLGRAGFRAAEFYGNYDRSPLTDESPEMIALAEKVG